MIRRPWGLAVVRPPIAPRSGASSFAQASRSEALNNKLACCLKLLPPAPRVAPETLDSSIFAPRRGASSDFQEKGAKMPVRKTACPPPLSGGGVGFGGGKNGWEIVSGRSWRALGALKSIKSTHQSAKSAARDVKRRKRYSRGRFWESKMMIFEGFFVFLPCAVLIVFLACCRFSSSTLFLCFWPCTQKAERPNSTHSPSENVFFQGARLRRLCRKDDNRWSKKDSKNRMEKDKQSSKNMKFQGPGAGLQKKHQK